MERRILTVDTDIELRELTLDEVQPIFDTLTGGRAYFAEWLPFVEYTQEPEDTRAFVESAMQGGWENLTCAVYYRNEFVGLIGLKDTDTVNDRTEIGYWLAESCQHKGIMTRACKALIDYAFDVLGMNRIQIKVATENGKSRRVAERLGFQLEGVEREGELHARGYVDLALYSLLKAERNKVKI